MSLGSESINQIISALKTDSIEAYCTVASSALILYDHLSTFSREVEFIWGRKFNSVTMLFYFNRWINFSSAILDLFGLFPFRAIPSCKGVILTNEAMSIVRIFIWTVFSTFRIYAISGGGWLLAIVVCVLNLVPVVTNAVTNFSLTSFELVDGRCADTFSVSRDADIGFVVSARLCVIAADILVLLITWSKTFGMKRAADRSSVKAPLTAMLLRDGTIYFAALLVLNILHIAGVTTDTFVFSLGVFETPITSIIITHFLVNLRQVAYGPPDDAGRSAAPEQSTIRFRTFVDNIGEQLQYAEDSPDPDMAWAARRESRMVEGVSSLMESRDVAVS